MPLVGLFPLTLGILVRRTVRYLPKDISNFFLVISHLPLWPLHPQLWYRESQYCRYYHTPFLTVSLNEKYTHQSVVYLQCDR
jgi:hypothetical protein